MTGALNLKTTGLILAETCESYPNGWTPDSNEYGSGAVASPGHSGSYGFNLADTASVLAGAYMRLYKSVDLKTGSTRIARIFRHTGTAVSEGVSFPGTPFADDFPGTDLDTAYWTIQGTCTVGGSIVTLGPSSVLALIYPYREPPNPYNNVYYTTIFRCAVDFPDGKAIAKVYNYNGSEFINVSWNWDTAYHLVLNVGATFLDLGVVPTGQHEYKVEWKLGAVNLYLDGNLIGGVTSSVPTPHTTTQLGVQFETDPYSYFYLDYYAYQGSPMYGTTTWKASAKLGSQTLVDYDATTGTGAIDNNYYDTGWVAVTPTSTQTLELKLYVVSHGAYPDTANTIFDDLIIMSDTKITIQGLLAGMKVELLDAGNVGHGSAISSGGDVTITGIDALIKTAYGFSGHFRVYDVDGSTPIYTSGTAPVWGGDVYQWVPNETVVTTSADHSQIYRAGSGLSPATAVVTATLTNAATGAPISGKSLSLTAVLGTCYPTSGTTDVNGKVTTTYTPGSSGGLGGVRVDWAGSATYAPSRGQQIIDIYYGMVSADPAKDFQVFIEGQEVPLATGDYTISADFLPQPFTIMTPVKSINAGGWWYVEIYRRGVKEFAGRIMHRNRVGGPTPQLTLTGVDEKIMLQRRVSNHMYLDDPKNIIIDLLSRYPCGITAGSIALYGSSIPLEETYENLFDGLKQIANLTGWVFRLNADRTLDFASTFGTVRAITVATNGNEITATDDEDWSQIDTTVYVIGSADAAALVGTSTDALAALGYGLIEEVFLEKSLTTQGAVDLRAQALIAQKKDVVEAITVNWVDTLATGAYVPSDTVTVVDADLNLSGPYSVLSIKRDLRDANLALLTLTQRLYTIADALQLVRATVKDLGVL